MKKVFICLLLAAAASSHAAIVQAEELTPERILSFADHLYEQGDYYRAITEYERLIFFNPRHPLAKTAKFQIAMCYYKGDKLTQAVQKFRALSNEYAKEELGRKARFMLAETYYQKKDYNQAIDVLESFLTSYPGDPQAEAARIKIGWSYLRQGNWRQAAEEFHKLPSDSPLRKQAGDLAEETKKYPELPRKSPALAGGLSAVLPGAGQLYVGRPADATVSFLLNGLFIWATVEAFDNDNKVTGGILLFFESGWYLGNVYNAMGSAHKYNRRAEQEFMDTLQNQYGISYYRDDEGRDLLAFTLRF
jgi:outer membrane protein assembly factor BamD (BamD/ComL family)/TM2 domain-containing membrane protein YozV